MGYFLNLIVVVVSIIIGIVPEGLSLAVLYCLSEYATLSIFKNGKLVFSKLKSLENMGRVSCLVLEKQGTFTNC